MISSAFASTIEVRMPEPWGPVSRASGPLRALGHDGAEEML